MRQEEIGRIIISKGGGGGASNTTTAVGSNSSINVTTIMSPISKNVIVTNNRTLSSAAGFSFKSTSSDDQKINDRELAQRKAEETAWRRNEATEWLREMDKVAWRSLPSNPSEEQFCRALRNGLILCNVLNKVNPGAVLKVVEIPIVDVQSTEGAAQSAIQYFENMRNFLVAVKDMKLLTFEASDLEKGGSSGKVVDCILCLKGYYEWKQAGGIGVWRYGGLVKIVSLPKGSPPSSFLGSESADESFDDSESSQYEQLLEFLHLSNEVSIEESKTANALAFLFDHFGLGLLQAYLREGNGIDELPLNAMVIDTLLSKVVKDFSALLVSQGTQLGLFLKKILKGDIGSLSRAEFMEAISQYLQQRTSMVSNDFSKFCICGGKREIIQQTVSHSSCDAEVMDLHKRQIKELRLFYRETKQEVKQIQAGWEEEVSRLEHYIKSLEVASSSYHKVLEENRQLYNQVQDLKGTIRVYCRVRPFLSGQSNVQSTVDYIGENGNIMIANPLKHGKDARKVFSFNKVFGTNVSQEQIYADTQPLVRSVLDGYNVCIFAYGQTGSGKTYTMNGPDLSSAETCGVNYRALSDLFQISKTRMDAIKYEVGVQMIEIYNEQVRDLLVSDGSNRRLDIRNNSQLNGLNVPDASWLPVSSTQDVLELMRIGQRNRAVGATALNERSSRSHSILTVHVYGRELVSGSVLKGCLHLVDLAGSERVDKSEALGERLKEAQHINRSLSALGDVIAALAQKSAHVPYRNSKLTQVLQDSLGGHAKTLMFVHINPEVSSIGETISTLKFAEKVSSIELGAARLYKEAGDIRELKEEISNLKQALERKEAELEQVKAGNGTRNTPELQRPRAVSPFFMPRCGLSANLKPEICQRPNDEMRNLEDRSCSSGKQRRLRFPSALTDKETLPKIPSFGKERLASTTKARSPSPPIRRSISTDRGAHIRGRVKAETVENQPVAKVPFPARVPVSKSIATIPMIPSTDGNSKVQHTSSQEPVKQVKAETVENQLVAKVPFPSRVPVSKSIATIPMIPSTDGNSKVQHTSSQEPVKQVKAETVENQLVAKVPFPSRVPVSKSIATMPIIPSTDGNSKVQHTSSQEPVKQVNLSGAFYNLHKVSSGKVHAELEAEQFCLANNIREGGISSRRLYTEHEEEQFRQALNIRQGGIRKSKNESKAKGKHQLPAAKFQKSDVRMAMPFDVEKTEEPRKSDFSEPENEHLLPMSPKRAALNVKKLQKSLSRNSQNLELRGMAQSVEPVLAGKLENKVPNNPIRNAKEGANTSMPELRRSRSTPRGKFFILP